MSHTRIRYLQLPSDLMCEPLLARHLHTRSYPLRDGLHLGIIFRRSAVFPYFQNCNSNSRASGLRVLHEALLHSVPSLQCPGPKILMPCTRSHKRRRKGMQWPNMLQFSPSRGGAIGSPFVSLALAHGDVRKGLNFRPFSCTTVATLDAACIRRLSVEPPLSV